MEYYPMSESLKQKRKEGVVKRCKGVACKNKVLIGNIYCEECKSIAESKGRKLAVGSADRNKHYNMFRRDKRSKEFYESREWKDTRVLIRERDMGHCQTCMRRGKYTSANTVHHIIPLKDDWGLRLEHTNLEVICSKCHREEHARLDKKARVER